MAIIFWWPVLSVNTHDVQKSKTIEFNCTRWVQGRYDGTDGLMHWMDSINWVTINSGSWKSWNFAVCFTCDMQNDWRSISHVTSRTVWADKKYGIRCILQICRYQQHTANSKNETKKTERNCVMNWSDRSTDRPTEWYDVRWSFCDFLVFELFYLGIGRLYMHYDNDLRSIGLSEWGKCKWMCNRLFIIDGPHAAYIFGKSV